MNLLLAFMLIEGFDMSWWWLLVVVPVWVCSARA